MWEILKARGVAHGRLTGLRLITAINVVAGLGIFFSGYDQGVMAGVNVSPDYIRTMGLGYTDHQGNNIITKPTEQGGIVAIYYLGTSIGTLLGGALSDHVGRIRTVLLGCFFAIFGAALQAGAKNTPWILCARIVTGMGTGIFNGVLPVWSAETSHKNHRGFFVSFEFTLNYVGLITAYWLEYGVSFVDGGNTSFRWRFPLAFQIVPLFALVALLFFMPESPRWLVKVGRFEEAKIILGRLRGEGDPLHPEAVGEFEDIHGAVELERETGRRFNYWTMLTGRGSGKLHLERRVQLSLWLLFLQAWTGITTITVYSPIMFTLAGYSNTKSQLLAGINNIGACLCSLIGMVLIDRVGRRWMLWVGAAMLGVCMFLETGMVTMLKKQVPGSSEAQAWGAASAFFVFFFTGIFASSWLDVPFVYPTETFPLEVRAKGNAFGTVDWGLGCGSVSLLVPVWFSTLSQYTFLIHGCVNFLTIPVVYCLYPETKQRTLEEMDLLFASDKPWVWEAEKTFQRLKKENMQILHLSNASPVRKDGAKDDGVREKPDMETEHMERSSDEGPMQAD